MPRSAERGPAEPPRDGERIAKLLARAGVASRREVERMIAEGRVAKDGVAIDTPATLVGSLSGVTVDGGPVAAPEPARLFLYHKPVGLLVTERDPGGRPTIYDRLPRDLPRLVPVGRLDLNTEGLLLLTTDGGLKRQLELPATGVERTYRARAYGQVSQAQLEALIEGVEVDGIRYGSIDANLERRTGANVWIELTLTEGKNREVRRVLEHLGLRVGRLIRTRYGPFLLGDLPTNGIGEVRPADLEGFRRTLKSGPRRVEPERIAVAASRSTGGAKRPPAARTPPRIESPTPAAATQQRRARPAQPGDSRPSPGLHRGGEKPDHLHLSGASRLPPSPAVRGKGAIAAAGEKGEGAQLSPPRPAKPQRKAGWAKPKPKARPGGKKPRA